MKKLAAALMFISILVSGCGASSSNDGQTGISITSIQSVAWENSEDYIEFDIDLGTPNETEGNIIVYFEASGSALDRADIADNPELQKGYVEIPPGSQTASIIIEDIAGDGIITETEPLTLRITGCSSGDFPIVGDASAATAVVMDGNGGNVTDIDGGVYHTVKIGTQTWMVENLTTGHLNDNTRLQLKAYRVPGIVWYDFNHSEYGMLYNWAAVSTGKLCPCGWHVPSEAEWTTLIAYLGGAREAGGKMKAGSGWSSPNTGATNSSGFTGFPGGVGFDDYRSPYPVFGLFGQYGIWWSNTESPSVLNNKAKIISLGYDTADAMRTIRDKSSYCSVRCLKD